jgi:hypothetical protein
MARASSGVNFRGAQQLAQVQAIHKFHEQEIKATRLAKIVDGDDVRMVQRRQRLGFAREAFGKFGVLHPFRREKF